MLNEYQNMYDIIIVGGGPAGLTAAIYAARAKEKVLVIEKNDFGGQIALTATVENYPGVSPCSGKELTDRMKEQAKSFGAELIYATITDMDVDAPIKNVKTNKGDFRALAIILAVGSLARKAGFKGETEFCGKGVAYCATCDGQLFAGCDLYVVGGGLSAVEEAIYLTKYARHITIVVREYDFTCSKRISDRLKLYPNIKVLFHTEIEEVTGTDTIEQVVLHDLHTGKIWTEETADQPFGVFVFVGYEPNTAWLSDKLERDKEGYLVTDSQCETLVEGVYAAGDVRRKTLRQVVTAAADGAIAAVSLEPYIKKLHERRNIPTLVKDEAAYLLNDLTDKAIIKIWKDDSKLSEEMIDFLTNKKELKDKVTFEIHEEGREDIIVPSIELCYSNGKSSGIHFHAVPTGLEWNSFQVALFNIIGPGQKLDPELAKRIADINQKVHLKLLTTLTCSNCPASVMSACQIAALQENLIVEIFDIVHFPKLRFKYKVMSVPTLIINDEKIITGKMNVEEMLDQILK